MIVKEDKVDDIVRQAMRKWPNVPACWGWLALDARGDWYMRDEAAQRAGPFAGPDATRASKGSRLEHDGLKSFIGRNYQADERGAWYFQNGPQRVHISLAETPWIVRCDGQVLSTHTGRPFKAEAVGVDERGLAYVMGENSIGLIHSMDMLAFSQWLELQGSEPEPLCRAELPQRFGFQREPGQP